MKEVLRNIAISKMKEVEKEIIEESYLYYYYSGKLLNEAVSKKKSKFGRAKNKILTDAELEKIKNAANKKKMIGIEQVCNIALWAGDKFKGRWAKGTGITLGAIMSLYAAYTSYFPSDQDTHENAKEAYIEAIKSGKKDETTVRFIKDKEGKEHMLNFLTPEEAKAFDDNAEKEIKDTRNNSEENKPKGSNVLNSDEEYYNYWAEEID